MFDPETTQKAVKDRGKTKPKLTDEKLAEFNGAGDDPDHPHYWCWKKWDHTDKQLSTMSTRYESAHKRAARLLQDHIKERDDHIDTHSRLNGAEEKLEVLQNELTTVRQTVIKLANSLMESTYSDNASQELEKTVQRVSGELIDCARFGAGGKEKRNQLIKRLNLVPPSPPKSLAEWVRTDGPSSPESPTTGLVEEMDYSDMDVFS
ncbi:hypothetical protein PQX77_016413 [Marasmius sp. AFHP31]|nr:hypothetical protein PQX77_016413 [Marasmius sp. AFHP31]